MILLCPIQDPWASSLSVISGVVRRTRQSSVKMSKSFSVTNRNNYLLSVAIVPPLVIEATCSKIPRLTSFGSYRFRTSKFPALKLLKTATFCYIYIMFVQRMI